MSKTTSSAATRAWRTRRAREALWDTYGERTYNVLREMDCPDALKRLRRRYGTTTVASILANATRGTYDYILGDCNF